MIVTVLLLALLVLVLVSLAALTRVETEIAGNSQKLAQARQNALMALNLAMGELQRTTGPDQRVTVTADMGTVGDGDPTTPDNGLPAAADGTYAWTGVLGNRSNPINPLDARKAAHTGETPGLLNWLVSGNENVAFTASTAAANFGQITAVPPASGAGSIPFGPASVITGLTATSKVTDTNLTITTPGNAARSAVLLVGPGSAANSVTPGAPQANYVVAPTVNIQVPAGQIPGFASTDTTPTTIGRYAWWVGDEGVKARINLDDPNKGITTGDKARLRTLVAARTGTEALTGFTSVVPENPSTVLSRVLSDAQLGLLSGVTAPYVKARFHDATPFSMGVLANVATGGLKKDLTAGLLGSTQPNEINDASALFTVPGSTGNPTNGTVAEGADKTYTGSNLSALRIPAWSVSAPNTTVASSGPAAWPNWGKVRSYVREQASVPDDTTPVPPQAPSDTQQGIHPIITRFQLFTFAMAESNGASPDLRGIYLPAIVLWNPYDVPLAAADYGVHFDLSNNAFSNTSSTTPAPDYPGWPTQAPYKVGSERRWPVYTAVYGSGPRDLSLTYPGPYPGITTTGPTGQAVYDARKALNAVAKSSDIGTQGFRFVVRSPVIQPGEAVVFTPPGCKPLDSDPRKNVLEAGWRVSCFYEKYNLGIPSGQYIRYMLGVVPIQNAGTGSTSYKRLSLGLGGNFTTGPSGVTDQTPTNLLQIVTGIRHGSDANLDGNRVSQGGRFVVYKTNNDRTPGSLSDPISGVDPLPSQASGPGAATWATPGASVNPDTTYIRNMAEWDPDWEGAEMDAMQVNVQAPPVSSIHYVFRMEQVVPNKQIRPGSSGGGGGPAMGGAAQRWLGVMDPLAPRSGWSVVEGLSDGYECNPQFPWAGIYDYHGQDFVTFLPTKFKVPTWDAGLSKTYIGVANGKISTTTVPLGEDTPKRMVLRHLPRATTSTLSIGALQHADLHPTTGLLQAPPVSLTATVPNGYAANFMPAQAIGNSLANPLVNAADIDGFPNNWNFINSANIKSESRWLRAHFDLSLLANRAVWDRYYFSGVPQTNNVSITSLNPRLGIYDPTGAIATAVGANTASDPNITAMRNFDQVAARQLIRGSFNINSTSREAWRAVLSSTRNAAVPDATAPANSSPWPRVNAPGGSAFVANVPASGTASPLLTQAERFRSLTDAQIDALAGQIVDEIRRRGPSLSLAGFVNRKPGAAGDPEDANATTRLQGFQRYLGPLQLAIDRVKSYSGTVAGDGLVTTFSGINDNLMQEVVVDINTPSNAFSLGEGSVAYSPYISRMSLGAHREITSSSTPVGTKSGSAFIIADAPLALRSRAAGIPGYLMQADLLQALGPTLSARSDTFRIRTYGEVKNPVTGVTEAKAWCEAIVQRVPDFVDNGDTAEKWRPNTSAAAANAWNPATSMKSGNLNFGRKYVVVSFRWLTSTDI